MTDRRLVALVGSYLEGEPTAMYKVLVLVQETRLHRYMYSTSYEVFLFLLILLDASRYNNNNYNNNYYYYYCYY